MADTANTTTVHTAEVVRYDDPVLAVRSAVDMQDKLLEYNRSKKERRDQKWYWRQPGRERLPGRPAAPR